MTAAASTGGAGDMLFDGEARFAEAGGAVFIVIGWQFLPVSIGWGNRALGFDSALDKIARRGWVFPAVAVA